MVEMNGATGGMEVPGYVQDEVERVLISEDAIRTRLAELGEQMAKDYSDKKPLLLGILTGSFVFMADLCRAMECKHDVAFVRAKSYVGTQSSGTVELQGMESLDITDRHVIIVEDIVDTGVTLQKLLGALKAKNPASLEVCTFLLKETERRPKELVLPTKYVAFDIPDHFVVGYGLDCDQKLRHLPFVGIYKTS